MDPLDQARCHAPRLSGRKLAFFATAAFVAIMGGLWLVLPSQRDMQEASPAAAHREPASASTEQPMLTVPAKATGASAVTPGSTREAIGVPATSPEVLALLDKIRGEGVGVPLDLRLREAADWHTLQDMWAAMSEDVEDARLARHKLGKRITYARLERGPFVDYRASKYQRDEKTGGVLGPWLEKGHPDEFITVRTMPGDVWREARIRPGEEPEFDLATRKQHDLQSFRKTEIEGFLAVRAVHNNEGGKR